MVNDDAANLYPADVVTPPPRLRVGVIGSGRVGAVLGAALRRTGHHIVGCSARTDLSRVRAEALLPGTPILPAEQVADECDLLLLAVPDDRLAQVVAELVGHVRPGQIVMHVSGHHGLEVLAPFAGALPIAAHPVMTFTGTSLDLDRLEDCPFGVTAPDPVRPIAEALVVEMGGDPVWVEEGARTTYHAALAHGANHLVTLVAQTLDLLAAAGVQDPSRLARPLLTAALDNALREGDTALTGPVARGDVATVRAHLTDLVDADSGTREAYLVLARVTLDRALASGMLTASAAEPISALLVDAEAGLGGRS